MKDILTVSSSPHIRHIDSTRGIMLDVIIALMPSAIWGCIAFYRQNAWLVLLTTVATAVLAEFVWNLILKKPLTINDLSAALTGLLLGMNLPPSIPLWMAAIGSLVAIIVVKQMFGGLGHNFANPAITARIVLMVSFPTAMTTFHNALDDISSATPLAGATFSAKQLFFGMHGGCIGEVSAFLLIVGGVYLVLRRVINPVIPIAFIGTVAILTLVTGGNVGTQVLSGGLMLGAIFMATDYTTSPTTVLGKLIFGIGCGILTFVIRNYASLPEGVSYSILIMNILVPHINRFTLSKPFGFIKEGKKNEG